MICLCVVTSFVYTECYISSEESIIELIFFKNIEFQEKIADVIYYFFEKYININFVSLFLGPAPLISCRTTLIFFQGLLYLKNIPCVLCSGYSLYKYSHYDSIIIQNFSTKYMLFHQNETMQEVSINDLENINFSNLRVGVVCRENHFLDISEKQSIILFPNQSTIVKKSFQKAYAKKYITKCEDIIPFI